MASRIEKLRTARTQLETVQAAIEQVELHGQSFAVDGVSYSRANVQRLYEREKHLERKIGRLQKTRPMASSVTFTGGYSK